MDNPFLKRATELLRDDEAFLAIVSPEPVTYFLSKPGQDGGLYDRTVIIRGTPGSGKTTLARLFEYPTLAALLRNRTIGAYRELIAALTDCGAFVHETPTIIGYRLPLETDYRDFWEFPYPDDLKLGLMTALIQARAVLGWIRHLTSAGIAQTDIAIIPRPDALAATEIVGISNVATAVKRAREVELSLYKIVAALVAPEVSELDPTSTNAYRPFDVIDRFRITTNTPEGTFDLRPLIILDDAHTLHPSQFRSLQYWLVRRELLVARWAMTRLDVLRPDEVFSSVARNRTEPVYLPGITAARDLTEIMLQSKGVERRKERVAFRKMAKDIANRYIRQMPLFSSRGFSNFSDLLSTESESLPASKRKSLASSIDSTQRELLISDARREALLKEIAQYDPSSKKVSEDVRLAMLSILMHRYSGRTGQRSLFASDADPDPDKPLIANHAVFDAGRIHLLHNYDLPYYFGIDDLCDASSENIEQFLRLASILVEEAAVKLVRRSKRIALKTATQHKLLRQKGADILQDWNFPRYQLVQHLLTFIAQRCLSVTLESNAWLGAGANAYGIPQEEFNAIPDKHASLASVLQFGIAYNAFSLVPDYSCKGKEWCLLELGGIAILHYGLTLKRGGFIEGTASELARVVEEAKV